MDWNARLAELLAANPLPSRRPAVEAFDALVAGDGEKAARRIAAFEPQVQFVATLVLEVAAMRRGIDVQVLAPLGDRLIADASHGKLSLAARGDDLDPWAREAGMHLSPRAVAARDSLTYNAEMTAAAARAAACAGRLDEARAFAEQLGGYAVYETADAWAVIGLAATGADREAALSRAAEAGNHRPWIQDGSEETHAHSIALGHFARGGLPADHPAVKRIVQSLLLLGQTRARKDARSYGVIEAACHAAERARQTDDPGWRAIAERLRDRAHTESLKDIVDGILAGTPRPSTAVEPDPRWREVWDAVARNHIERALQLLDATIERPSPWTPHHRTHGDILPEEPVAPPVEPSLDPAGLADALKGASTAALPGIARRVDASDGRAIASLVKVCGLKKHRKKRADLEHVVEALCLAGEVDAAIDTAHELVSPTLHGHELKDVLRPLADDLARQPTRWTDARRSRVLAMLAAPDPSFIAHVLLSWVEADVAADRQRELDLRRFVHERLENAGDRRAGELALAMGLCRIGDAVGPERLAALSAEPPAPTRMVHRRRLFGWVERRTRDRPEREAALAVALRLCVPNGQAYDHPYGMADLERAVRDVWRAGYREPVSTLLGSELPAPVHRDLRWMIWADAEHAPDPMGALWAAWPRDDDGPTQVQHFIDACVVISQKRKILKAEARDRLAAFHQLYRVGPRGWNELVAFACDDALPSDLRVGAAIAVAPPIPHAQIEQVAGSLLVSPDPVLRAQAIIMAARFAVTSLAASLEALAADPATFWDLDRHVSVSSLAHAAVAVLRTGQAEPSFPDWDALHGAPAEPEPSLPGRMMLLVPPTPSEESYRHFRSIMLDSKRSDLAVSHEEYPHELFGILMEARWGGLVMTLACLADGTSSQYLSNGYATVGGGFEPAVRAAAIHLVTRAQHYYEEAEPVTTFPTPDQGQVFFYFLLSTGEVRRLVALEDDLSEERNPLSALYYDGHRVLTEMRLIEEQWGG